MKDFYSELSFEEFQSFTKLHQLHDVAGRCTYHIQQWIAESLLCSEATALMIFWGAYPYDYQYLSWKAKRGSRDDEFDLIRTIIDNFEKGFYQKTDITYNPAEAIAKIKVTPQEVQQACNGEEPYIYIDPKEVYSWFGDYLDSKLEHCDKTMELYNIVVSLKQRDIEVYARIIDHPLCDKAIALIIYWLLDKYSNSSLYAEEWKTIELIQKTIVQRLHDNHYLEVLAYDPAKNIKPFKWRIPDYIYQQIG